MGCLISKESDILSSDDNNNNNNNNKTKKKKKSVPSVKSGVVSHGGNNGNRNTGNNGHNNHKSANDMFSPGDIITVSIGKSNPKQEAGLKLVEGKNNGQHYYVRKVPSGGLFADTPVIAGDKILEMNGVESHEFTNIHELKKILKDETKITVLVLRMDPDDSEYFK